MVVEEEEETKVNQLVSLSARHTFQLDYSLHSAISWRLILLLLHICSVCESPVSERGYQEGRYIIQDNYNILINNNDTVAAALAGSQFYHFLLAQYFWTPVGSHGYPQQQQQKLRTLCLAHWDTRFANAQCPTDGYCRGGEHIEIQFSPP